MQLTVISVIFFAGAKKPPLITSADAGVRHKKVKTIFLVLTSAAISTALVWWFSEFPGQGYPSGPEQMFVLPILVFLFITSALLVHPTILALTSVIGSFQAAALVPVLFSSAIAILFYRPDVDSSLTNVIVGFAIFLGLPLFLGAIIGNRIVNRIWKIMPNNEVK